MPDEIKKDKNTPESGSQEPVEVKQSTLVDKKVLVGLLFVLIPIALFGLSLLVRKPQQPPKVVISPTPVAIECSDERFFIDGALENPSIVCTLEIDSDEAFVKLSSNSAKFINLEYVYLRAINATLSSEFTRITSLKTIDFHHTTGTVIPSSIRNLKNLEAIRMNQTDFDKIPKEIGDLSKLTRLIIILNSKPVLLPEEIGRLSNLNVLTLSRNPGVTLPETLSQNQNIEYLDLSDNKLKEVPEAIAKLKKLKSLNLADNNLQKFPKDIEMLSQLEYLNLSGNKIRLSDVEQLKKALPNTNIVF